MKPIKKEKLSYDFRPNVPLLTLSLKNNEWQKVVENPWAFFTNDREFEPIKKEKEYGK